MTYQWQRDQAAISGATSASYTTPPASFERRRRAVPGGGEQFRGQRPGNPATLNVSSTPPPPPPPSVVDVVTYHNDNARTGQELTETVLNPATSTPAASARSARSPSTARWTPSRSICPSSRHGGCTHNVVYVATEHDSVYAFDSEPAPSYGMSRRSARGNHQRHRSCGQVTPEIGITSTPVIDRKAGPHGVIYVVAMSKAGSIISSACTRST